MNDLKDKAGITEYRGASQMMKSPSSNVSPMALIRPSEARVACGKFNTAIACVNSGLSALSVLRKEHGEQKVMACLALWINDLQSFLNISAKMNAPQIMETCAMILDGFYFLNLADVRLVMSRAKKGEYGQLYGRIDGQIIYQWFSEYFEERSRSCSENAIHDAERAKSEVRVATNEEREKVLKMFYGDKKGNNNVGK